MVTTIFETNLSLQDARLNTVMKKLTAWAAIIAVPTGLTDDAVRAADVVITMGCGDTCPVLPGKRYEDWAVGDPALASPEGVAAIRDDIDRRVRALLADLLPTGTPTSRDDPSIHPRSTR
jgi:arsenate reductase